MSASDATSLNLSLSTCFPSSILDYTRGYISKEIFLKLVYTDINYFIFFV